MTFSRLVLSYTVVTILATLANLGVQRLVLAQGNEEVTFALAVGAGTFVGLVTKYLLDKKWIFHDVGAGMKAHTHKFSLYTAMGLVTTAIFWGVETVFWFVWQTDAMREIGAIIGLSIGYYIKFHLDRRFVFTDKRLEVMA